jgi:hypothetical protein
MSQHYGFDISSNNRHPLDWAAAYRYFIALGDGAQPFVIEKISQGTGYVNEFAKGDIAAAHAAGFIVGGYLMDQGNDSVVAEEALFRANSAGVAQFDDDELPEGLSTGAYIAHLQSLVAQADVPQYLNQSEENEGFPPGAGIWEANYNGQPGTVHRAGVLIHQYTSNGVVPGCSGVFDLNVFLGNEAQFDQFFGITIGAQMPTAPTTAPSITEENRMIASTPTDNGYWVCNVNGEIESFGDAQYLGALNAIIQGGEQVPVQYLVPGDMVTGFTAHKTAQGYWISTAKGFVYAFGAAVSHGNAS